MCQNKKYIQKYYNTKPMICKGVIFMKEMIYKNKREIERLHTAEYKGYRYAIGSSSALICPECMSEFIRWTEDYV